MNKRFVLTLLSSPVLFTSIISMVMLAKPVHASQVNNSTGTHLSCVQSPHSATSRQVCIQVSNAPVAVAKESMQIASVEFTSANNSNDVEELNFTEAESNQAIQLFGCDCPSCLNAVRQLNGLPPLPV